MKTGGGTLIKPGGTNGQIKDFTLDSRNRGGGALAPPPQILHTGRPCLTVSRQRTDSISTFVISLLCIDGSKRVLLFLFIYLFIFWKTLINDQKMLVNKYSSNNFSNFHHLFQLFIIFFKSLLFSLLWPIYHLLHKIFNKVLAFHLFKSIIVTKFIQYMYLKLNIKAVFTIALDSCSMISRMLLLKMKVYNFNYNN